MLSFIRPLSVWSKTHGILSKGVSKGARIALGKDPSKVQCYVSSGKEWLITWEGEGWGSRRIKKSEWRGKWDREHWRRKREDIYVNKNFEQQYNFWLCILVVCEDEITHGILNNKKDKYKTCFWFKRVISDLYDQRPNTDTALSQYCDITEGRRGLEFNTEAIKSLNYLKETRLSARYIG